MVKKKAGFDVFEIVKDMQSKVKGAFFKIKDELNDHRECLNQNTNEIQSNYEYMCKIEAKIDKLAERMDEVTLILEENSKKENPIENQFSVSTLTKKEQEVFMVLYLMDTGATYNDISKRTGLTENLVICYVTNLIAKGVPLLKKYLANGIRIYLDEDFRRVQAQNNILKINESVSQSVIV